MQTKNFKLFGILFIGLMLINFSDYPRYKSFTLGWEHPGTNENITNYRIYRRFNKLDSFELIAEVPKDCTRYRDRVQLTDDRFMVEYVATSFDSINKMESGFSNSADTILATIRINLK